MTNLAKKKLKTNSSFIVFADISVQQGKKKGWVVFFKGSSLSSRYDPIAEGNRLFKTLSSQTQAAICLGLGPLYHLPLLLKTLKKIILVEPRFQLKENDLNSYFPFLGKKSVGNVSGAFVILDKAHLSLIEKAILLIPSNIGIKAIQIFDLLKKEDEEMLSIKREVVACLDKREKNLNTENYFSKIWNKNILFNLEQNPVRLLNHLKVDAKQGVLIASGPSLEKQLEKKADKLRQKKIFKCALPGVLSYLLSKGIVPDCILSSDASFYNSYHFEFLKRSGLKIPLIAPLSIARHCTKDYPGKVYYFIDDIQVIDLLSKYIEDAPLIELRQSFIDMQGSVTVSGLFVFSLLGIREMSVIGADFSCTPFKSHALSNTTEELMFSSTKRLKPFENRYHYLYGYHLKKTEDNHWRDSKLALYKELFERARRHLGIVVIALESMKINVSESPLYEIVKKNIYLPELLKANWKKYKADILRG